MLVGRYNCRGVEGYAHQLRSPVQTCRYLDLPTAPRYIYLVFFHVGHQLQDVVD